MKFTRLDNAMDSCKKHLDTTKTRGTEIESYIVGYMLVAICSEFEIMFNKIIEVRAKRSKDQHLCNFIKSSNRQLARSMFLGDIAGSLGRFGDDWKKAFHAAANGTPAHVGLDSIMTNRTAVAHLAGTTMTFAELEAAYQAACGILMAIGNAVGLDAAEIAALS
jgi:hypothetical protein